MASLTNTKIKNTYVSLLKVADNGQLDAALQDITDGAGNVSGIQLNTGGDLTASGTISFGSLKDSGENITITKFVDAADGIGSNDNDTTIPTSAAVKLYVDTNITAQDLDFATDSGTGAVDLDSQTFSILGTANEIETSGTGQTVTIGLPSSITVDVTGNLTGNVSGNVTGNLTGNVSGNVTGDVTGDLTGNVTATSVLVDGVTATTQSIGDNSTKVATTAYVDAAITAEGLDFAGDAGSGTIDLDSETFTIAGTANEIETNASGNTLTVGLPSDVTIGNDLTVTTDASVGGTFGVTGTTTLTGDLAVDTDTLFVDVSEDRVGINKAVPTVALDVVGDITSSGSITGTLSATSSLADGVTATTQAANDNSTKVATTAYVDAQVTLEDLDFAGDSGTGAVDLDSQTFTIAGTANEIETSASGQTITIGLPTSVTVGTLTATTLGGTLSTAAQTNITSVGTLSSLAVSGNLTVDTNTLYVDAASNEVGIGTSSPSEFVQVAKNQNATTRLLVSNSDSTNATSRSSIQTNANGVIGEMIALNGDSVYVGTSSNHDIKLMVNGSERFKITTGAALGINNLSPAFYLDQAGTGRIGGWFTASKVSKTVTTSGTAVLQLYSYGSNIIFSDIIIRVSLNGNSALNAQFGYFNVSVDTGTTSYLPSISTYYNESVGSFQVTGTDFTLANPSANVLTLTYQNQAYSTNVISVYVRGFFDTISLT